MSRYIDTDDIKMAMSLYGFSSPDQTITEFVEDILPSADVKPVVRGEWEMINPQLAKCSVCGGYESTNGKDMTGKGVIFKTQKKYCPHCGARMVEE